MEKYVKMLKELASTVKEHVNKAIDPIKDRLVKLEEKLSNVESKELHIDDIAIQAALLIEKPKDGINGVDGKSVTVDDIKPLIDEAINQAVKQIPVPENGKDGVDGKSVTVNDVQPLIQEAIDKAVKEIPTPKDGKDVEIEQVRQLIVEEIANTDLPRGEKGDKGDAGEKGEQGIQGEKGEAGLKGIDGKNGRDGREGKDGLAGRDGENGKDALQIDILPYIEYSKIYPRGSYASYNGGLWHAIKNTQGMDGWVCIVDGVKDINVNFDGERGVSVDIVKSSNQVITKSFDMPVMIYKDIYSASHEYKTGDTVTWGGSLWCCLEPTRDKPGESKSWRLCAKKGRDGKDGLKGDRGEKGERGDSGRDLTQLGTDGRKW